jgi:hypothetical protein
VALDMPWTSRWPIVLILDKNCILSFWSFHPLLFFWLLKCSKKNLRKWTWKQEMKTEIFVFQPILGCFIILERVWKSPFEIKHGIYREVFDYRDYFFELTSTISKNSEVLHFLKNKNFIVLIIFSKKPKNSNKKYSLSLKILGKLQILVEFDRDKLILSKINVFFRKKY